MIIDAHSPIIPTTLAECQYTMPTVPVSTPFKSYFASA